MVKICRDDIDTILLLTEIETLKATCAGSSKTIQWSYRGIWMVFDNTLSKYCHDEKTLAGQCYI